MHCALYLLTGTVCLSNVMLSFAETKQEFEVMEDLSDLLKVTCWKWK